MMVKNKIEIGHEEINEENYIPSKKVKKFDVVKKIKMARALLFWPPIIQIASSIVFLILLIVNIFMGAKMGFDFTKLQLGLALAYVAVAILISVVCFMIPAKKVRKKASWRMTAIATLILSTLILSGSFVFWAFPILLFYALITLIVWVLEVIAAITLIFVVEELPNER